MHTVVRPTFARDREQSLIVRIASLVTIQVGLHLAVGLDNLTDTPGSRLFGLMNGSGGDETLDVEIVPLGQEAHQGLSIIRLVFDIG